MPRMALFREYYGPTTTLSIRTPQREPLLTQKLDANEYDEFEKEDITDQLSNRPYPGVAPIEPLLQEGKVLRRLMVHQTSMAADLC